MDFRNDFVELIWFFFALKSILRPNLLHETADNSIKRWIE